MEVYFYCSYEHSQRGFFMTRLTQTALVPAIGSGVTPPEVVREFFSYDRFGLLWRDLCGAEPVPTLNPPVTGSFFGLRGLTGAMSDGRNGVVNLAFHARTDEEMTHLRRTVLAILGDYDRFVVELFAMLRTGGDCGYELDTAAFCKWLEGCRSARALRPVSSRASKALGLLPRVSRREPPKLQTQLLHLAVCSWRWDEIHPALGSSLLWRHKPRCVLTPEQFHQYFQGNGPLWELKSSGT